MILRTAAVLTALIFVPVLAEAQDPPPDPPATQERTHVVREGETLASIARSYLGATEAWQRIWEANRQRVPDPNRIFPGMELVIPGVEVGAAPPLTDPGDPGVEIIRGRPDSPLADVRGVEITGDMPVPVGPPDPPLTDDRRDLLRSRPFTPGAVPEFTAARTVFHGTARSGARAAERPGVWIEDAAAALAVSPSAFHAAAWLLPEGEDDGALGRITAFPGEGAEGVTRTTLQPFDLVRVELAEPSAAMPGDRLVAFHEVGTVRGWGRILAPSGMLDVEWVEDGGVLARVTAEFDHLQLGHRVRRPAPFPLEPGVQPGPAHEAHRGVILGFRDRKEIYLPGDEAFIDLGADAGLSVGDELVGLVGEQEGWAGQRVARFQVVGVGQRTATVRLTRSESPTAVRPGLAVVLDRTMP